MRIFIHFTLSIFYCNNWVIIFLNRRIFIITHSFTKFKSTRRQHSKQKQQRKYSKHAGLYSEYPQVFSVFLEPCRFCKYIVFFWNYRLFFFSKVWFNFLFLFSGIGTGLLGIFTLCILRWSQFFSSCWDRCLWNWRQENSIQCFQNFISFANYCKYYYCRDLIFRMFGNLQGEFENLMYFVWI